MRVAWIGGSTVAGKSTIATKLAERNGLIHLPVDATWREHASRIDPASSPATAWWLERSLDELWIETPPAELAERTLDYDRERFEHITADVRAADGRLVVEGFHCFPNSWLRSSTTRTRRPGSSRTTRFGDGR